ncbi:DUF3667 domain-containing protein [Haliea sp. E17]|uniref:DUF3667 domain-containing protein n=1 Tax=Haliea sp. E17 TaxID=3401576 RepID=UPI003AAEDFEC
MEQDLKHCRNCGAVVRGQYCADCGQREGIADQRFLDVARDLASDFIEIDSRFWRTLYPLMLRPGLLSAEYFAGRRARYLPPLRLYLVLSFCLFLYFSFATSSGLAPAIVVGDEVSADSEALVQVNVKPDDPNDLDIHLSITNENSPEWLRQAEERMEHNIAGLRDDPGPLVESMLDYAPQVMFLLLPLFALLVQFAYLFSPFHYLQHLVFALHYHSFTFLLYLLDVALEKFWEGAGSVLILWMLCYLPLALRRAYGSGWGGALGKSLLVYVSYGACMVMASAAVAVMALLLL